MSALLLYKFSGSAGTCSEPRCGNSGRYQILLAGHRCDSKFGAEVVCRRHAREIERMFSELAPTEEAVVTALEDLRGSAPERVDAIGLLREIGYSRDAIAQAVKGVADRLPLEQVLDVLAGERVEVAA